LPAYRQKLADAVAQALISKVSLSAAKSETHGEPPGQSTSNVSAKPARDHRAKTAGLLSGKAS
jgi:hypothetical protein